MKLYLSSRRTIMDGEVVTFATAFYDTDGPIKGHKANGPFDISASREMVVVHHAQLNTSESFELFIDALHHAMYANTRLRAAGHGAESLYPSEPTEVPHAQG